MDEARLMYSQLHGLDGLEKIRASFFICIKDVDLPGGGEGVWQAPEPGWLFSEPHESCVITLIQLECLEILLDPMGLHRFGKDGKPALQYNVGSVYHKGPTRAGGEKAESLTLIPHDTRTCPAFLPVLPTISSTTALPRTCLAPRATSPPNGMYAEMWMPLPVQ